MPFDFPDIWCWFGVFFLSGLARSRLLWAVVVALSLVLFFLLFRWYPGAQGLGEYAAVMLFPLVAFGASGYVAASRYRRHDLGNAGFALDTPRAILRFYGYGIFGIAVAGCAIFLYWLAMLRPSVGDATSRVIDIVLAEGLGFALIVVPLLPLWGDERHPFRSRRTRLITLPMVVFLLVSVAFLSYSAQQRQLERDADRTEWVLLEVENIRAGVMRKVGWVLSVKSFFDSSFIVTPPEFQTFTQYLRTREPDLAIGWAPELLPGQVEWFVRETGREPRTCDDSSKPAPAGTAEANWIPLHLVEPREEKDRWIGIRLETIPELVSGISQSRRTGKVVLSEPFQHPPEMVGMIGLVLHVKRAEDQDPESGQWLQSRDGFILALLPLKNLFVSAADRIRENEAGAWIEVSDESGQNLYSGSTGESETGGDEMVKPLRFLDREWMVTCHFSPVAATTVHQVLAQTSVLLSATLFGALVLLGTGYTSRIEKEVDSRTLELAESKALFDELAQTIGEVFWIRNAEDGRFLYISPGFTDIWGRGAVPPSNTGQWLASIHTRDRGRYREAMDRPEREFDIIYRVHRADGALRWVQDRGYPVPNGGHGTKRVVGVSRDVTDLHLTRRELERSNRELEHFAYIASHDLREPLRTVASFVQLLERKSGDVLDAESREFMDFIVDGTTRMKAMIDGLLEFSKIETDGRPMVPVDLGEAAGEARENLSRLIEETGASIELGDLPVVMGDRPQLVRLLQNLVSNAIKYSLPDRPRVRITCERRVDTCELCVEDHGIGIPREFQERIFGVFQRVGDNEHAEGSGIGLAVARRIAERHDGKIRVESEPGVGSRFYVELCLAPPTEDGKADRAIRIEPSTVER